MGFLARHLRLEDDLEQAIKVKVMDKGVPALASFCRLNVTFDIDVNELTTQAEVMETTQGQKLAPPTYEHNGEEDVEGNVDDSNLVGASHSKSGAASVGVSMGMVVGVISVCAALLSSLSL